MLDHEMYELIQKRMQAILQEKIKGKINVSKDEHNFYIFIRTERFGDWRYTIYNVDEIDFNKVSSDSLANLVCKWHTNRVLDQFFVTNSPV